MDTLKAIGVRRGLVLGFIALALILATLIAPPGAKADVDIYLDENDRTTATIEFANTILEMNQRFPETGDVVIEIGPTLNSQAFAQTMFGTVVLQEAYAENPGALEADVQANVDAGYFPRGCSAARLVAIHEFGHVLDNAHGDVARDTLLRIYGDGTQFHGYLPGYSFDSFGRINPPEALANAFAAVMCGTANALEQDMYRILVTSW